jgi:hypothetical protein
MVALCTTGCNVRRTSLMAAPPFAGRLSQSKGTSEALPSYPQLEIPPHEAVLLGGGYSARADTTSDRLPWTVFGLRPAR